MTPFGRWELVSKFLRDAGSYPVSRNLPIVHLELISSYVDFLRAKQTSSACSLLLAVLASHLGAFQKVIPAFSVLLSFELC